MKQHWWVYNHIYMLISGFAFKQNCYKELGKILNLFRRGKLFNFLRSKNSPRNFIWLLRFCFAYVIKHWLLQSGDPWNLGVSFLFRPEHIIMQIKSCHWSSEILTNTCTLKLDGKWEWFVMWRCLPWLAFLPTFYLSSLFKL